VSSDSEAECDDGDFGIGAASRGLHVLESADLLDGTVSELSEKYSTVVNKIRKLVKIFRKSPTKNDDILQPYIKQSCGRELQLILDCKTRWSSLFSMLHRFMQVRNPIQKALVDLRMSALVSDEECVTVQETVSALEPVKLAVEALCRRDTTLLSGEAAIKFCVLQLRKQKSELATSLVAALRKRITERRALHASVLQYLHNAQWVTDGADAEEDDDDLFNLPSTKNVKSFIFKMIKRLELDVRDQEEIAGKQNTITKSECIQ
jgi:hypothetical protein